MWPFKKKTSSTERTPAQYQELVSHLRRKIRNQSSQLKQLNTAILRKNHLIKAREEALFHVRTWIREEEDNATANQDN